MSPAQRNANPPEAASLSPQSAYQLWASHYDSSVNPLLALEERRLDRQLATFACKDVVDLGCGTGRWLRKLECLRPRSLTGVDLSPAMLDQARLKCTPTTRLLVSDCIDTPLPNHSADRILASFLLSYLSDLPAFARESARILRIGGSVLVSDLHPNTASYGWRRTFRAGGTLFEIETKRYTLPYLVDIMQQASFRLDHRAEWPFGPPEARIFERAGKRDSYLKVQSLPVVYYAQFTLEGAARDRSAHRI
jgi:ubiquinone/menaquinone biosynthesis C-methylase UbiE